MPEARVYGSTSWLRFSVFSTEERPCFVAENEFVDMAIFGVFRCDKNPKLAEEFSTRYLALMTDSPEFAARDYSQAIYRPLSDHLPEFSTPEYQGFRFTVTCATLQRLKEGGIKEVTFHTVDGTCKECLVNFSEFSSRAQASSFYRLVSDSPETVVSISLRADALRGSKGRDATHISRALDQLKEKDERDCTVIVLSNP